MKSIIDFLDKEGSIDDDSVMYATLDKDRNTGLVYPFPFTLEEFRLFTEKIWTDVGGWDASEQYHVPEAYFETYHIPFEYDGKKYVLNIMYGQGSAWTLFTEASHIEYKKRCAEYEDKDEDATLPD